jgi:small subunit ribosomal protein S6
MREGRRKRAACRGVGQHVIVGRYGSSVASYTLDATSCSPGGPSRPEEVDLRDYEVMLILPADADESVVGTAVDRISRTIADAGGDVRNIDRWGRRRFAYEIDKQTEGYYVVVSFKAEPSALAELDRALLLADEIVRFKVVVRAAA